MDQVKGLTIKRLTEDDSWPEGLGIDIRETPRGAVGYKGCYVGYEDFVGKNPLTFLFEVLLHINKE